MEITRKSRASGNTHTMDLPITQEQIDNYDSGMLCQRAFPNLTPDQREFYMTGTTAEEWDAMFSEDEKL